MGVTRSFWARLAGSSAHGASDEVFLQKRVTLYVKILFFFILSILLLGLVRLFIPMDGTTFAYTDEGMTAFAVMALVAVGVGIDWWFVSRKPRPMFVLHMVETGGTVLGSAMVASIALMLPPEAPGAILFLVVLMALVIRAAVVPSSPWRTFAVGIMATGAIVGFMAHRCAQLPAEASQFERFEFLFFGVWGLLFSIATSIVSRVIYGLQRTVRQALQLGNYTLEHKLGEGGMGAVYLAHHALLRRPTAVKLLPPDKAGESAVARFEREVQETSQLHHPNTIQIFDFGRTPEGIFYYAMEYLEGLDLAELVELFGPQPVARVIYILSQASHALAEAHERGLIHRDVKPANIVLCNRGGMADMAKVVDFGLVKDLSAPSELGVSGASTITGTPLYMAPETVTSPDEIDHRADLYALGAVGYFLLTGTHVFDAKSAVVVLGHHLHTEPERPSARIEGDLPGDIEEVLLRCLNKKPDDRFDSGRQLHRALRQCADANRWGLDEATAWWDANADRIREFRMERRIELGSGSARTIAIALGERGLPL